MAHVKLMCADMETKISSQACKRRSLFLIFFWGELSKLKVQIVKLISSMSEKVAFSCCFKKVTKSSQQLLGNAPRLRFLIATAEFLLAVQIVKKSSLYYKSYNFFYAFYK
jgi:hypothetical protein